VNHNWHGFFLRSCHRSPRGTVYAIKEAAKVASLMQYMFERVLTIPKIEGEEGPNKEYREIQDTIGEFNNDKHERASQHSLICIHRKEEEKKKTS